MIAALGGLACRAQPTGVSVQRPAAVARVAPVQDALTMVWQWEGRSPETIYVGADRMRVDSPYLERTTIIDARAGRILEFWPADQSYIDRGPDEVRVDKAVMGKLMMRPFEHASDGLPPDEAKTVDDFVALLKSGGDLPVAYERTGERRVVNGIACEVYRLRMDESSSQVECIATWSDNGVFRREDFASIAGYARSIMVLEIVDRQFAHLDSGPGFPVSRGAIIDGKFVGSKDREVLSATRGPLDNARFEVPAGFTERKRWKPPNAVPNGERAELIPSDR